MTNKPHIVIRNNRYRIGPLKPGQRVLDLNVRFVVRAVEWCIRMNAELDFLYGPTVGESITPL